MNDEELKGTFCDFYLAMSRYLKNRIIVFRQRFKTLKNKAQ